MARGDGGRARGATQEPGNGPSPTGHKIRETLHRDKAEAEGSCLPSGESRERCAIHRKTGIDST